MVQGIVWVFLAIFSILLVAVIIFYAGGFKTSPSASSRIASYRGNINLFGSEGHSILSQKTTMSKDPLMFRLSHKALNGEPLTDYEVLDSEIIVVNKGENYESWRLPTIADPEEIKKLQAELSRTTKSYIKLQGDFQDLKFNFDERIEKQVKNISEAVKASKQSEGFKKK